MNDGFTRQDGVLCWDGCSLDALAREHGTPLYVLNPRVLEHRLLECQESFGSRGVDARVFFSVKTNAVPAVLKTLFDGGAGAEVINAHELRLVRALGLDGARIVVGGTIKDEAFLRAAIETEVAMLSVESIDELERAARAAEALGRRCRVALRVDPEPRAHPLEVSLHPGGLRALQGFAVDDASVRTALDRIAALPDLELVGFHFHLGTGITRAAVYGDALERVISLVESARELGHVPRVINIGGGFHASPVRLRTAWEALRGLGGKRRAPEPAAAVPSILDDVADRCAAVLRSRTAKLAALDLTLYLEPGRLLAAESEALLVTVGRVERSPRGLETAFCDGGAMTLSPLFLAESHETALVNRAPDGTSVSSLRGPMPMPLDILHPAAALGPLEMGDIIAVLHTGAYYTELGNTWWGPRPAICAIKDGQGSLVRRRETFEDLLSRDVLMAELAMSKENPNGT